MKGFLVLASTMEDELPVALKRSQHAAFTIARSLADYYLITATGTPPTTKTHHPAVLRTLQLLGLAPVPRDIVYVRVVEYSGNGIPIATTPVFSEKAV